MSITISPEIESKFINVPYKLGGRDLRGCDCIGLVVLWLREQGLDYNYDQSDAFRMKKYWETSPSKFVEMVSEYGIMIPFFQVRKFDFLFFYAEKESVFPTLPAVMVDDRHFLISKNKDGGSEVLMLTKEWKDRFWGAIKLRQAVEKGMRCLQ